MRLKNESPIQATGEGKEKSKQQYDNSISAQCNRLLERLRKGPCTTIELRHEEDSLGVGPRIYDLRHKYGYNIQTFWTTDLNPGGGHHRVAKYVLQSGKYKEVKHVSN